MSHEVPFSCDSSERTSSRLKTTGIRLAVVARVMLSSHGSSISSTWR